MAHPLLAQLASLNIQIEIQCIADRERVREIVEHGNFIEIYCDAPLEVCEARDVKGIYEKARTGQIPDFTGISAPYEIPENPELTLLTGTAELDTCVQQVITELTNRSVIAST